MQILKFWLVAGVLAVLAACGGGGGSPGSTGTGTGTGTGSGTGTGTGTTGTPTLVIGIFNSTGVQVTSIATGGGFVARATVMDSAGAVVASKLVTFNLNGATIAVVAPASALTNSIGVAEVTISPASISSVGAASVSATADVGGVAVSGRVDFSVQASSLSLSPITLGSSNLPSGGNTALQVTALIGGVPSTGVPVNVSYTVSCGRINGLDASASGVSVTTNGSGAAPAVYTAVAANGSLCSGAVNITAASAGATPQFVSITVAAATANAVSFVSATPAQIFVAGSGAVDQSLTRFKVLSSAGTALANIQLQFSIVTNPGGVGLNAAGSTAAVTATTNSLGEATVSVFSGTIPGPVKVRAALVSDASVFAESQNLSVSSGPPSQRFMSLSVETFNIEGWDRDGSATQLTVRLADRQGNAVEDGTVVNFTAEGGQVASSCATLRVAGISQCSVNFVSQNPRPAGGRASVLAYTEGTKDYIDVNGNNRYDAGVDTLVQIGDAFRDDNENALYDAAGGEFLIPRGGTAACTGAGEPFPSRANTCDSNLSTTVRQQTVILFSSSTPVLETTSVSTSAVRFKLRSTVNNLLPMPEGTTVSASATGGSCAINQLFGTPIPNVLPTTDPLADLATTHVLTMVGCAAGDSVTIRVKVPSGLETIIFVPL
jgi:hypothetical protein